MSYAPLCAICKQPVNLEESQTNEHGDAVHENCYIWVVELKKPRRRITNMSAFSCRRDSQAVCAPGESLAC